MEQTESAERIIHSSKYKESPSDLKTPPSTSSSGSVHGESESPKETIHKLEQENKNLTYRLRDAKTASEDLKAKADSKVKEYENEKLMHKNTKVSLNKTLQEFSERDAENKKQIESLTKSLQDLRARSSRNIVRHTYVQFVRRWCHKPFFHKLVVKGARLLCFSDHFCKEALIPQHGKVINIDLGADKLYEYKCTSLDKLTDNNKHAFDLTDMNRPSKLGEVYTELYVNEWTDAYDALTRYGHSERNSIDTLKNKLMTTFHFCEENSLLFMEKVNEAVNLDFDKKLNLDTQNENQAKHQLNTCWKPRTGRVDPEQVTEMGIQPIDVTAQIRTLEKEVAASMLRVVQKKFIDLMLDKDCVPAMMPYIKRCLFICWIMIVQSPPMCFAADPKSGEYLDTDVYRTYTSSGKYIDYVVFPALLLHKGGPLLCKGIVQTKTVKKSKGKSHN